MFLNKIYSTDFYFTDIYFTDSFSKIYFTDSTDSLLLINITKLKRVYMKKSYSILSV